MVSTCLPVMGVEWCGAARRGPSVSIAVKVGQPVVQLTCCYCSATVGKHPSLLWKRLHKRLTATQLKGRQSTWGCLSWDQGEPCRGRGDHLRCLRWEVAL